MEPKANKWAAEQIVAHRRTKTNTMFEVLWKAGDKSWMTYDQVKELNLIVPYLELLGLETIQELTDQGKGEPPLDDLQVFLGYLDF